MKEIMPCPFCGGVEVECIQYDEDGDLAAIFCRKKNCGASGPPIDAIHGEDDYDEEASYDKALGAWNLRAALDAAKEGKGMILTEKEAKEKWCPQTMPSIPGDRNGDPFPCVASECMAWRWKDETCNANGEGWKGYCGLAGRPEPMAKEG